LGSFILLNSGCKKEAILNDSSDQVINTVESNAAITYTTNLKVDNDFSFFVPCANGGAGELVQLSGSLHLVFHTTITGNNFHGKFQGQPQGISGYCQTTGDKYQATGVSTQEFNGSFTNGQFQSTFVNNFSLIGEGPGNNFLSHANLLITINANGTVTASMANITGECK
jgi:hypothetical protein